MTVINKSPEIQVLQNSLLDYVINLGQMRKGTKKTAELEIQEALHSRTFIGCMACTKSKVQQNGNTILLEIEYSANSKGDINKKVVEHLQNGDKINFTLTGKTV